MPDEEHGTLEQLQTEFAETWAEFQRVAEIREAELKSIGHTAAETAETLAKLNGRLDALEVKLNRPLVPGPEAQASDEDEDGERDGKARFGSDKKAFDLWARTGIKSPGLVRADGFKSLQAGDDTEGGYLAADELSMDLLKEIVEWSPVRTVATVRPTTQRTLKIRKRTGTFAAQWVADQGTRTETEGLAYGMEEMPMHELYALVDVSKQDLEDSEFDLEAELMMEFAEQFGVAEGTAFISGNGVGQPEGLLTHADIPHTPQGHATLLDDTDALMLIQHAVKSAYANAGTWALNRTTLGVIRVVSETTTGKIWEPNIGLPTPPTIGGRPYIECPDMPDIGAGTFPVLFGDFRRGYIIGDRVMLEVTRDPYTQAASGNIRFIARKRVGGQVKMAEAFRKLEIAAS